MTKEIIHGLGAHADIPVTPEEDRAFAELAAFRQVAPAVSDLRTVKPPQNVSRFPAGEQHRPPGLR